MIIEIYRSKTIGEELRAFRAAKPLMCDLGAKGDSRQQKAEFNCKPTRYFRVLLSSSRHAIDALRSYLYFNYL